MAKETPYFSHDYGARNDPKLQKLQMKMGMEGLGIYWCLVEISYEQEGLLSKNDIISYAFQLRVDVEKISQVLSNFDLFVLDSETENIYSKTLIQRLKKRLEKSKKAAKSVQKRWEKYEKEQNTNVSKTDTNVSKTDTNVFLSENGFKSNGSIESSLKNDTNESKNDTNESKNDTNESKNDTIKESKVKESKVNEKNTSKTSKSSDVEVEGEKIRKENEEKITGFESLSEEKKEVIRKMIKGEPTFAFVDDEILKSEIINFQNKNSYLEKRSNSKRVKDVFFYAPNDGKIYSLLDILYYLSSEPVFLDQVREDTKLKTNQEIVLWLSSYAKHFYSENKGQTINEIKKHIKNCWGSKPGEDFRSALRLKRQQA